MNAAGGWHNSATSYFIDYIEGNGVPDIWMWNDAPERTQAEVVAALRSAAALAAPRVGGES